MKPHRKPDNPAKGRAGRRRNPFVAPVIALVAGVALIVVFAAPWKRSPSTAPVPPKPGATAQPRATGGVETTTAAMPAGGPLMDPSLTDANKAALLINRGTDNYQRGLYWEAVTNYAMAVKLIPDDETAHFNLGLALARVGKAAEAKQAYLEALRIFPDYAEAHNNLGNLLVNQGQLTEATEHLTSALRLTPDSASAHNNYGTLLIRQGKVDAALTNFAEAVRLMPEYLEARSNLGHAYFAQGKPYEAAAEFQEVLRLNPGFEPAKRGMARIAQQRPIPLAPVPQR